MADPHDATAHVNTRTDISLVGHGEADHAAAVKTIRIRKTVDETIVSNAVSQDDDQLFFSIAANEVWAVHISCIFNSGTVPDWKYQVTAPTGATGHVTRVDAQTLALAFGTDSQSFVGLGTDQVVVLGGIVANGSTAGTVQFKWAQSTSDAGNTTVKANSFLIAHRVA